MSPVTYEIVSDVSARYGLSIELIVGRCRAHSLLLARIEIAKRLRERGYKKAQIGRVLNRDPSTVVFYIGSGKRKPAKRRWRAPRVRHLHWTRSEPPPAAVKAMRQRFLIPYAGADMTEYVWRRRAA